MLKLDHLVIVAPSLQEGAAHVRERLGLDMAPGGRHPEMGTHNLLMRLGDEVFLEVIAVDLAAPRPDRPRWFGLDDVAAVRSAWDDGRRLRGWVARTDDLDAVLARHGALLGEKIRVSRGDRFWHFGLRADGSLPERGVAPPVIDWGSRGNPAADMPDQGAILRAFTVAHPDPDRVNVLYLRLGIVDPPTVEKSERPRLRATIETPGGIMDLD